MNACIDDVLIDVAGRDILLPLTSPTRPLEWAEQNKTLVETILHDRGALLIRGLRFHSTRQFGQFLEALFDQGLSEYSYRSTPRTKLGGNVYTATEYHPSETIPQHNESSYASVWPMRIGFFCMIPSAQGMGGATPLADSREVLKKIPAHIVEKFERKKLQYVRNYGRMDLPWSEVFQMDDKLQVEAFCRENGIEFEWIGDNGLRTRQITPATLVHPVTGQKVWFNQAHLFHLSALPDELAQNIASLCREDEYPRNVYFGDGSPIDVEDLDCIRAVYDEMKFHFNWQKDDILLLDNVLYTHGRQPYSGDRKILVGMAKLWHHT